MESIRRETCDFLILGSGLAGLAFALKVAKHGRVVILSKAQAPSTNTSMAQGGIAAVIQPGGSVRDAEVFAVAERLGLAMFVGGGRTFRH